MQTAIPFFNRRLRGFDPTSAELVTDSSGSEYYIDSQGNAAIWDGSNFVGDNYGSQAVSAVAAQPGGQQAITAAQQAAGGSYSGFLTSLVNMIPQFMQFDAQHRLMQINLQRAQQGLPPIDASRYTPGIQVGATSDTQRMVYVVAGLAAIAWVGGAFARRR